MSAHFFVSLFNQNGDLHQIWLRLLRNIKKKQQQNIQKTIPFEFKMAVFFCFVFWWTLKNGRPWTISFPWKTKEKRFSGLEHFKKEEEKKRIGRCRRIVKVTLIHILELYAIKSYLIRVLYGAAYRQIHIRHFFLPLFRKKKKKKKKNPSLRESGQVKPQNRNPRELGRKEKKRKIFSRHSFEYW